MPVYPKQFDQHLIRIFAEFNQNCHPNLLNHQKIPGRLHRMFDSFAADPQHLLPYAVAEHLTHFATVNNEAALQQWFIELALLADDIFCDGTGRLKARFSNLLRYPNNIIQIYQAQSGNSIEAVLRAAYISFVLQNADANIRLRFANQLNRLKQNLLDQEAVIRHWAAERARQSAPSPAVTQSPTVSETTNYGYNWPKLLGLGLGLSCSFLALPVTIPMAIWKAISQGPKVSQLTHYLMGESASLPITPAANFWQGFKFGLMLPVWPIARFADLMLNEPVVFKMKFEKSISAPSAVSINSDLVAKPQPVVSAAIHSGLSRQAAKQHLGFSSQYHAQAFFNQKLRRPDRPQINEQAKSASKHSLSSFTMSVTWFAVNYVSELFGDIDLLLCCF